MLNNIPTIYMSFVQVNYHKKWKHDTNATKRGKLSFREQNASEMCTYFEIFPHLIIYIN